MGEFLRQPLPEAAGKQPVRRRTRTFADVYVGTAVATTLFAATLLTSETGRGREARSGRTNPQQRETGQAAQAAREGAARRAAQQRRPERPQRAINPAVQERKEATRLAQLAKQYSISVESARRIGLANLEKMKSDHAKTKSVKPTGLTERQTTRLHEMARTLGIAIVEAEQRGFGAIKRQYNRQVSHISRSRGLSRSQAAEVVSNASSKGEKIVMRRSELPARTGPSTLSAVEKANLLQSVRGETLRSTARRTAASESTAQRARREVFDKLGVKTTAGAAVKALDTGQITPKEVLATFREESVELLTPQQKLVFSALGRVDPENTSYATVAKTVGLTERALRQTVVRINEQLGTLNKVRTVAISAALQYGRRSITKALVEGSSLTYEQAAKMTGRQLRVAFHQQMLRKSS